MVNFSFSLSLGLIYVFDEKIMKSLVVFLRLDSNFETAVYRIFFQHKEKESYKFEASHVCLVGKNCNKLELNNDDPEKETTSLVWKRVKCSCPSKFNFECTRIVCARHLKACSSFKANKSIRLRKCDH